MIDILFFKETMNLFALLVLLVLSLAEVDVAKALFTLFAALGLCARKRLISCSKTGEQTQ